MVVGWGSWGPISYISPGIQIGYNNNEGIFYGFQISTGFTPPKSIKNHFSEFTFIPSICFGFKRYHKKYNEKYIDLQSTFYKHSVYDKLEPPIGIGFGKYFDSSNIRFKLFTWYITSFTFDYELKKNSFNFSLIPLLPLGFSIDR